MLATSLIKALISRVMPDVIRIVLPLPQAHKTTALVVNAPKIPTENLERVLTSISHRLSV
jgi:hypothetical protein